MFGFKARTTGDGVVEIKERGAGGAALVGILQSFFESDPSSNVLRKWIIDVAKGAEKVLLNRGKLVRHHVHYSYLRNDRPKTQKLQQPTFI